MAFGGDEVRVHQGGEEHAHGQHLAYGVQTSTCPIEATFGGRCPGEAFGLRPVLDRLMVVVREPTTERVGPQKGGDTETGYGVPVAALQADVMALDGERGGETTWTGQSRFERAGRPVVYVTLSAVQAALKTAAIFAKVVEDTGKMTLVFRSERLTVPGG
jgi:hypothetical protein